jgi:hypothetical protein
MKEKKYKLLKKYPSLPDNWEIGMIVGLGDYPTLGYAPTSGLYHQMFIPQNQVEKNPEFWKEIIVNKPYKILSLNTNSFFGITKSSVDIIVFEEKNIETWTIHSVERLSDGEIFTIGDKIWHQKTINKIELYDDTLKLSQDEYNWSLLHSARKNKVLFKTEDGVEIFNGDKVWYISLSDNIIREWSAYYRPEVYENIKYLFFSTKEEAEDYLLIGKNCLSIKEIAPLIGQANMGQHIDLDLLTKKLLKIVKEKK